MIRVLSVAFNFASYLPDGFVYSVFCRSLGLRFDMHVITRKRLNDFAGKFPETKNALADWYRLMKQKDFDSIAEIRAVFPSADKVGKLTVFNIGGNKVSARCGDTL